MATNRWLGTAVPVSQVNTVTVGGTPASGQAYTVAMGVNGSKTVAYTATGSDTNSTIAAALQALLAASTIPEFAEAAWTVSGAVVTGTANTAGYPFSNTSSATGTGTLVTATATASAGPNDVSTAANWSTGATPTTGDNVYITNTNSSLLYGLSALSGATVSGVTIDSTFTGTIGLPQQNANGYWEYRQRYFQLGVSTFTILTGTGGGSGQVQFDFGSVQVAATVANVGSPSQQGLPAVILKGTNASNTLTVTQGSVGSTIDPGDASTWSTVNIGYQTSQQTDVTMLLGSGCTLTTINQDGGQLTYYGGATTHTQRAGSSTVLGTGAVGALDVEAGTCLYQSTGTITTLTVGDAGTVDFTRNPAARTVTNATVYGGGTLLDGYKSVTFTNAFSCPQGAGVTSGGANIDLGTSIHIQRS
jgi:hypothetical protein